MDYLGESNDLKNEDLNPEASDMQEKNEKSLAVLIEEMNMEIERAREMLVMGKAVEAYEIVYRKFKKVHDKHKSDNQLEDHDQSFQPAYYILGECCLEMGQSHKAQDFLVAAYWNSVRKGNEKKEITGEEQGVDAGSTESHHNKTLRHRAFTKLFAKQGKFDKAISELSSSIYLMSITHGPESPLLVSAYQEMGDLYLALETYGSTKIASRFFEKVRPSCFLEFFLSLFRGRVVDDDHMFKAYY